MVMVWYSEYYQPGTRNGARKMIQPHIGDRVKSIIYSEAGIVTAIRPTSDRPDTQLRMDDDSIQWVFSQTEIEPA